MLVVHFYLQRIALLLIIITENGTPELFNLADNVPRLVVADVLHNVLQNPLKNNIGMREVINQEVYSLFLDLYVV